MHTKTMTLGEILKNNIKTKEEEKQQKIQREIEDKLKKEATEEKAAVAFFESVEQMIISKIQKGDTEIRISLKKYKGNSIEGRIANILGEMNKKNRIRMEARVEDIYLEETVNNKYEILKRILQKENLNINIVYEHDGVGINSWYSIEVTPE